MREETLLMGDFIYKFTQSYNMGKLFDKLMKSKIFSSKIISSAETELGDFGTNENTFNIGFKSGTEGAINPTE